MGGANGGGRIAPAWSVLGQVVAQDTDAPGFIVSDPVLDSIAEMVAQNAGVFDKRLGRGPDPLSYGRYQTSPNFSRSKASISSSVRSSIAAALSFTVISGAGFAALGVSSPGSAIFCR